MFSRRFPGSLRLRSAIVPADIADDFALLTAQRLLRETRLLFVAMLLTIPPALWASSDGAPWIVRVGLPSLMGLACLAGIVANRRITGLDRNVRRARWFIDRMTITSAPMAAICSAWCVVSWLTMPEGPRGYYPLILAMGSLATGYCLASVRRAAIINILIGLVPISLLLLATGERLEMAAGASLLIAMAFLIHVIDEQHGQLVRLLTLQREMRALAETDPLTGLLNRRAIRTEIDALIAAGPMTLILFDLDRFKPVNDRFGHSAGDRVLAELASRLHAALPPDAKIGRIGGDEFAALLPGANRVADPEALRAVLRAPFEVGQWSLAVDISIGIGSTPGDGTCLQQLFEAADRRLYAVKAERAAARTAGSAAA